MATATPQAAAASTAPQSVLDKAGTADWEVIEQAMIIRKLPILTQSRNALPTALREPRVTSQTGGISRCL
jgi:hypothetical protein